MVFERLDLQLFAGENEQEQDPKPAAEQQATTDEQDNSDQAKTFSQEELDRIIAKRIERERKTWEERIEEEKRKAKLDEVERLREEKAAADQRSAEMEQRANRRLITAEAKTLAADMGITDVNAAVRLADFVDVVVDGDDVRGVKEALERAVDAYPILKGERKQSVGRGANPGGTTTADRNPWFRDTFNLTEQGRILREDPDLAQRLKAAAKAK